jgi:hypothetical protein
VSNLPDAHHGLLHHTLRTTGQGVLPAQTQNWSAECRQCGGTVSVHDMVMDTSDGKEHHVTDARSVNISRCRRKNSYHSHEHPRSVWFTSRDL